MPIDFAIASAVQWVVSPGGSANVSFRMRSATSAPSGLMREGRVLLRSRPNTPSAMNRSCQRQTAVLATPASRMIAFVPNSGSQEHDATAPDVLLRSVAIANYRLKTAAIGRRDGNGDPGAHAPDSHAPHRNRITTRIFSLGRDH